MNSKAQTVLAVDPGRKKCGVAVVRTTPLDIAHRSVIETACLGETIINLEKHYHPDVIVIGDGTTSAEAAQTINKISALPVESVDEKFTSLLARKMYFQDNPPRGLRRFIPISLQTPNRPHDDYVAIILAQRYLGFSDS